MKNDHLFTLLTLASFKKPAGNTSLPKSYAKALKIETVDYNKKFQVIVNNSLTDGALHSFVNSLKKTGMPEINGSISIRGLRVVVERAGLPAPGHVTLTYTIGHSYSKLTNYKSIPLSTSLVGVDKALLTNACCFTNIAFVGAAIINFKYNLPKPADGEPVAMKSEIATASGANSRWRVSNTVSRLKTNYI